MLKNIYGTILFSIILMEIFFQSSNFYNINSISNNNKAFGYAVCSNDEEIVGLVLGVTYQNFI